MIKLDVQQYCHDCNEFEAEVKCYNDNHVVGVPDPFNMNPITTITKKHFAITCKYRDRCKAMEKHIRENIKK